MDFVLSDITYKIKDHRSLRNPTVSQGETKGHLMTSHDIKGLEVSIETIANIYSKGKDETLSFSCETIFTVSDATVFRLERDSASLLAELYLVHQNLILGTLYECTKRGDEYRHFLSGSWTNLYQTFYRPGQYKRNA